MKVILVSVYDVKAEAYNPPAAFVAIGQAVRWFSDLVSDANHPVGKHPSDYRLYRVGEFDDSFGALLPSEPVVLCTGDNVGGSRA